MYVQKHNYNYGVDAIRFEWDERKNEANLRKHGVRFEEAALAFEDPLRISRLDRVVDGEERWQTFGRVGPVVLLMVAHTVHEEVDGSLVETIRIISARQATNYERREYEDEDC
ncbi:MAG TPA: BrnT family toxin [Acidobacteriaceae bacterium]|nr:BrnT family toxin [Acidobacteriaceae bacterium]